jgi:hypothetical protein
MTIDDIDVLVLALRLSWGADTSGDPPNWTETNPAIGQCGVTALVVQDQLGGSLAYGIVNGGPHYWNVLPTEQELDLARQQFCSVFLKEQGHTLVTRDYLLGLPDTARRYYILRHRVTSWFSEISRWVESSTPPASLARSSS